MRRRGKTKRDGQMPVSRGMAWKNQLLDFFLILHQNSLDDVDLLAVFNDLLALLIRLFGQFGTFNLNVFCTGDIREHLSAVQLVLNSLLALSGVVRVQIGVAGNSVGEIALIQLLDEVGVDAFAWFSRIDNTGGEEMPVNMEAPATATADRPATFRKERRDRIMVVSS